MLTDFTVRGFRCFEHLEIPRLRRFNLITGKNGTGKTTLLEAHAALAQTRSIFTRRPSSLVKNGSSNPKHIFDIPHLASSSFVGYR